MLRQSGSLPRRSPGPGYLAALDLKKTTFTAVGYGLDGYITGSLLANHPFVIDDGIRSYRDVGVITEHDAFPDRFLKITASVCFGDSGGPLFHNGTVVALNTWTFSTRCTGPNLEYRTDSAAAQRFLAANLPLAAYEERARRARSSVVSDLKSRRSTEARHKPVTAMCDSPAPCAVWS